MPTLASSLPALREGPSPLQAELRHLLRRSDGMLMKSMSAITVTMVRDVVETDYSGQNSIRRTEKRDVAIILPEGSDPLWSTDDQTSTRLTGDWRIVAPPIPRLT